MRTDKRLISIQCDRCDKKEDDKSNSNFINSKFDGWHSVTVKPVNKDQQEPIDLCPECYKKFTEDFMVKDIF